MNMSGTTKVEVYLFEYDVSTTVHLIATPGFDGSVKTDTNALEEITA